MVRSGAAPSILSFNTVSHVFGTRLPALFSTTAPVDSSHGGNHRHGPGCTIPADVSFPGAATWRPDGPLHVPGQADGRPLLHRLRRVLAVCRPDGQMGLPPPSSGLARPLATRGSRGAGRTIFHPESMADSLSCVTIRRAFWGRERGRIAVQVYAPNGGVTNLLWIQLRLRHWPAAEL